MVHRLAIVIVPGVDWSYVPRGDPPLKWQGVTGAYFTLSNRVPVDP